MKMSQAIPFLKLIAEQNGIKLNRAKHLKQSIAILKKSIVQN